MNNFGETVRRLRIEKGLSQQQLADHLHVSRPTVANWEVSRRIPDATMVALIADALGVEPGALLATAEVPDE
ncbi:MAG: helix-turn-helix transcriptional regulator, partial [Clostridia bacterium]|nr:helix-turn-helix transcriptional regulator [Clostridia bacterium]